MWVHEIDQFEMDLSIVYFVMYIIGATINLLLLYAIFKEGPALFRRKSDLAATLLVASGALWTISLAPVYLHSFATWQFTSEWCNYYGIALTFCAGSSMAGHMLLAFDRYSVIVLSKPMANWVFVTIFCVFQGLLMFFAIGQLVITPTKFYLMEVKNWCFFPFHSNIFEDRLVSTTVLFYSFLTMSVVSSVYILIYLKYIRTHNRVKNIAAIKNIDAERKIFFRCVAILIAFLGIYGLTFVGFFIRYFSGDLVPLWFDVLASTLTTFEAIVTPMLLVYLSPDYRKAVRKHLFLMTVILSTVKSDTMKVSTKNGGSRVAASTSHITSNASEKQKEATSGVSIRKTTEE